MNESNANGTLMTKYLCVKSVYAEPMLKGPYLGALSPNQAVSEATFNEPGYRIIKQNGDVSWKPKESFEKSAKPLPEGHNGVIIDVDPRDGSWAYIPGSSERGIQVEQCIENNPIENSFIDRIQNEFDELNYRLKKLQEFINSEKFKNIKPDQQTLLFAQSHAMSTYASILWGRLVSLRS